MFTLVAVADEWRKTASIVAGKRAKAASVELPENFETDLEDKISDLVESCGAQSEHLQELTKDTRRNGTCLGALPSTDDHDNYERETNLDVNPGALSSIDDNLSAGPETLEDLKSVPLEEDYTDRRPTPIYRIDPRAADRAIGRYFERVSNEEFYRDLEKWSPGLIEYWSLPDPRSAKFEPKSKPMRDDENN